MVNIALILISLFCYPLKSLALSHAFLGPFYWVLRILGVSSASSKMPELLFGQPGSHPGEVLLVSNCGFALLCTVLLSRFERFASGHLFLLMRTLSISILAYLFGYFIAIPIAIYSGFALRIISVSSFQYNSYLVVFHLSTTLLAWAAHFGALMLRRAKEPKACPFNYAIVRLWVFVTACLLVPTVVIQFPFMASDIDSQASLLINNLLGVLVITLFAVWADRKRGLNENTATRD